MDRRRRWTRPVPESCSADAARCERDADARRLAAAFGIPAAPAPAVGGVEDGDDNQSGAAVDAGLVWCPATNSPPWVSIGDLNEDQQTFLWAIACDETMMVTAEGGCGKTETICRLVQMGRSGQLWLPTAAIRLGLPLERLLGGADKLRIVCDYVYSYEELHYSVLVMSTSGTAAANFAGLGETIHSVLGLSGQTLGTDAKSVQRRELEIEALVQRASQLRVRMEREAASPRGLTAATLAHAVQTREGRLLLAKVLVLDEYSMLGKPMLELLDKTLRRIFNAPKRFMGRCSAFCGDPGQLRAVTADGEPFQERPTYQLLADNILSRQTWFVNYRQRRDPRWAAMLRKLRDGCGLDPSERRLVLDREDRPKLDDPPPGYKPRPLLQEAIATCRRLGLMPPMRLWYTHARVDACNAQQAAQPGLFGGTARPLMSWSACYRSREHCLDDATATSLRAAASAGRRTWLPPAVATELHAIATKSSDLDITAVTRSMLRTHPTAAHAGFLYRPGMPLRYLSNEHIGKGVANGTRLLFHCALTPPFGMTRDAGSTPAACTVHSDSELRDYDYSRVVWRRLCDFEWSRAVGATSVDVIRIMFEYLTERPRLFTEPDALDANCTCTDGILVTAMPDSDHPRTMVLPPRSQSSSTKTNAHDPITVVRRWHPAAPDCARTIHSAQGQTCAFVSVGLADCMMSRGDVQRHITRWRLSGGAPQAIPPLYPDGLAYTAFSRVATLSGLVLEYGQITEAMLTEGTDEFRRLWGRHPDAISFCNTRHVLRPGLVSHPSKTRWIDFQTRAPLANDLGPPRVEPCEADSAPAVAAAVGEKRPRPESDDVSAPLEKRLALPAPCPAPAAASASSAVAAPPSLPVSLFASLRPNPAAAGRGILQSRPAAAAATAAAQPPDDDDDERLIADSMRFDAEFLDCDFDA